MHCRLLRINFIGNNCTEQPQLCTIQSQNCARILLSSPLHMTHASVAAALSLLLCSCASRPDDIGRSKVRGPQQRSGHPSTTTIFPIEDTPCRHISHLRTLLAGRCRSAAAPSAAPTAQSAPAALAASADRCPPAGSRGFQVRKEVNQYIKLTDRTDRSAHTARDAPAALAASAGISQTMRSSC